MYHLYQVIEHWLAYHTGSLNTPGTPPNYNFFSGSGSDFGELSIAAALFSLYGQRVCHEPRCWWPGHMMADGHTRSCWRHNPDGRPKRGHVMRAHIRHLNREGSARADG